MLLVELVNNGEIFWKVKSSTKDEYHCVLFTTKEHPDITRKIRKDNGSFSIKEL